MAFCNQCGTKNEEGAKFCTSCGAPMDNTAAQTSTPVSEQANSKQSGGEASGFAKYFAYTDTTANFKKEDIDANKIVSILSYIHILVIVPLLAMKESPFAQYHAKVGLNLLLWHLVAEVGGSILTGVIGWIPVIGWLVSIAVGLVNFALWCINIFGIVSAAQGKARELTFLESFMIIK